MATKGVELASAYISLSISTDNIPEQVEKELKGTTRTAEKYGKEIGRKFSDGASSTISGGSMSKALARELGSAGDKASKELLRSLAAGHRQAEQNATVAGRNYARAMASAMTGGSKDVARRYEAEFRNALNARASSQHFFDEFHRDGVARGRTVGTLIGKAVGGSIALAMGAATAGLTAAVGGIGYTLFKGFDRYRSLDATAKRLQAMGKSGDQVKTILGDISEVVKGTPIALDEAAGAATKFLSGGVKEGQELNEILTSIADAAGASGQNFGDLATIFGQVMNKGKLQAEEMNQLNERGINIQAALRDEFGLTADQLTQMSEDGTISFGMLVDAIEGKFGGMAKKMGDTIDGAIGNLQTSVARVGANFLAAIFGDPMSTTEGPGGMAQSINNLTTKLDGVNQWVITHKDEIKGYFDGAVQTAKDLAENVKSVATFLNEHREIIAASAAIWLGWKAISATASLIENLKKISTLLGVTIPADAAKSGTALSSSLIGPGAAVVVGSWGIDALFEKLDEKLGTDIFQKYGNIPGSAAWFFNQIFGNGKSFNPFTDIFGKGSPSLPNGTSIGQGPGANANQGNALDPGFFMGAGGNARDFAHGSMLPFWQDQGFTVGDHAADQFGEHQNGALDIMVKSIEEGNKVLQQVLKDPNVYGAIFNNQTYGYGHGTTPQDYSAGHTGDPNQDHLNHVHVWYKPGGGGNIAPMPAPAVPPSATGSSPGGQPPPATVDDFWKRMLGPGRTFGAGGAVRGPGTSTSDSIPAYLSDEEHVLTSKDVAAMGGQAGVYAFRNALHRNTGGEVDLGSYLQGKSGTPRGSGVTPESDWLKLLLVEGGGFKNGWTPGNRGVSYGEPIQPGNFRPGIQIDTSMASVDRQSQWPGFSKSSWLWSDLKDQVVMDDRELEKAFRPSPRRRRPTDPLWNFVGGFADGGAVDAEALKKLAQQGMGAVQLKQAIPPPSSFTPGQTAAPDELPLDGNGRTEGYIPAGAGFSGKTGGGIAGSFVNLGSEAIQGVIQAAADVGKMAASAAAAGAGAPGAGGGAGAGIQVGADIAKRGVQYGAELINIGIGGLTEILTPFGAPRWLSDVDPTAFIPNTGGGSLATTAAEALSQGAGPGMADPNAAQHGLGMGAAPGPFGAAATAVKSPGGVPAAPPAAPPLPPNAPPPQNDPMAWLKQVGIFDSGGVLKPNSGAVNLSNQPEYVLTGSQWKTMEATASQGSAGGVTNYYVQGKDLNESLRELKKVERRNSGPTMRGKAGLG